MKAANGGMLHSLFDYSHPHLLGGNPHRPTRSSPRMPTTTSPHRQPQPQPSGEDAPQPRGTHGSFSNQGNSRRGDTGHGVNATDVSGSSLGGQGGRGHGRASSRKKALGRRFPRSLVVHGTADATVPFSQTAAVGAALKTLGVPTVVRYDPGGETRGAREKDVRRLGMSLEKAWTAVRRSCLCLSMYFVPHLVSPHYIDASSWFYLSPLVTLTRRTRLLSLNSLPYIGDHFGVVGQLMFSEQSLVETAISHFTSQQAKHDARQERAKDDTGTDTGMIHVTPRPRNPQPHSRL